MTPDSKTLALAVTIVLLAFGGLFWSLRIILNNGVKSMQDAMDAVILNMDKQCKLIAGNLHGNIINETKQRVSSDERIEASFKKHGHKGLDDDGNKITI